MNHKTVTGAESGTVCIVKLYYILTTKINREVYHGLRWREDPRFAAPMIVTESGEHIYVHDCVHIYHPLGIVTAIVCRFFQKVRHVHCL